MPPKKIQTKLLKRITGPPRNGYKLVADLCERRKSRFIKLSWLFLNKQQPGWLNVPKNAWPDLIKIAKKVDSQLTADAATGARRQNNL